MGNFATAYAPLQSAEGGYVNDPADPGGETYAGITRKYNPSWQGWALLDAIPNKTKGAKYSSVGNAVQEFYYTTKWIAYGFNKLDNADIGTAVLDTVVNHGAGPSLIQKALVTAGKSVSTDGKIGPATLSALNTVNVQAFLTALYNIRKDYYQALITGNPALAKFLPGWLKRIDKFNLPETASLGIIGLAAIVGGLWFWIKSQKSS